MQNNQSAQGVPYVAPQYDSGLEVVPSTKDPALTSTFYPPSGYPQTDAGTWDNVSSLPQYPQQPRLICGLRRTTFWLLVALAALIVVGAVGGGVGGSIAAKKSDAK